MRVCSFDLPGVKVLQLELLWALYCFQINYGMRKNISGVTKKKKKKVPEAMNLAFWSH